jgi:RNA polymerase sigma-70 factor (ECF subfamily)
MKLPRSLPKQEELLPTRWTLIERLKNWDDQESWREFFETYWKLIYGVAVRSGLDPTEAQEVVQETVISVAKGMPKFRAGPAFGSFKSWLLNLTRWRIVDQVRKRPADYFQRQQPRRSPSGGGTSETSTAAEVCVADPSGNALENIWNQEWDRHLLDEALKCVQQESSPAHYQIFYLQVIKQLPAKKVAETLGVEIGQVYLVKHRLSKIFKETLKRLEAELG